MSDFHYDEHFSVVSIRKAIDIVNGLGADLVVLTGDFVTVPLFKKYLGGSRIAARFIEPCANLLAQVHARRGVLAILGNHDAGSDPHRITEALQAKGITVLRNRFALSGGSSVVGPFPRRAGSVSSNRCALFAAIRKEISQRIAPNPWLNSLHEYWDWYHSSARALLLST